MKKERKDAQTTLKMPTSLRNRIDEAAEELGISSMEYIRRACEEKLDRDTGIQEKEMRELILKILQEQGIIHNT